MTKVCTKCGIEKNVSEFFKRKDSKCTFRSNCKSCMKSYEKENKERISAAGKAYRAKFKEVLRDRRRLYAKENPEKVAALKKRDYHKHIEKRKNTEHSYYLKNKENLYIYRKKWANDNKGMVDKRRNEMVSELKDCYVRALIRNRYGMQDPPEYIVSLRRTLMLASRELKQYRSMT